MESCSHIGAPFDHCLFQLSVTINVPGEDPYIFQPRLFGKVMYINLSKQQID